MQHNVSRHTVTRHIVAGLAAIASVILVGAAATAGSRGIILAQGTPEVCTQVYQPVCGTDASGKRTTYSNECFARAAKATNVSKGECPK